MSGGGPSTQTAQQGTSTGSLPSWLTGPYQAQLGSAGNLLNQGLSATGSQGSALLGQGMNSIAGVNPQSIGAADTGLSNILGGAYMGAGQSQMGAANPAIASEAGGSLMNVNSNPYLQGMYTQGLQGIQNNVDSQFGAAGRNVLAGAPIQADQASTLANSLLGGQYATNLGATQNAQSLASGNYNTGVGNLTNAAGVAPGVTSGLYAPGQAQLGAGQTPYNLSSWYQGLLGQSASPFGQTATTGNATQATNPGLMGNISSIFGDIGQLV